VLVCLQHRSREERQNKNRKEQQTLFLFYFRHILFVSLIQSSAVVVFWRKKNQTWIFKLKSKSTHGVNKRSTCFCFCCENT
jgi:cytoskeletal protein RodZ